MKLICTRITVLVLFSLLISTPRVFAADNAAITATAIIQAGTLTVTNQTNLSFGTITLGAGVNTVTINASAGAAGPVVTGTATVLGGASGLLEVSTTVNADVTLTYAVAGTEAGTPPDILDNGVDANTLAVTGVAANSTASPYTITAVGSPFDINVGGIITIPNGQAAQTYTGTITVTASY